MRHQCCDRPLIRLLAGGKCPPDAVARARPHLAECARCRGAVAAAATRAPGFGDTVLLPHPDSIRGRLGRTGRGFVIAVSMATVAAAWFYGAEPPAPTASPPEQIAAAL